MYRGAFEMGPMWQVGVGVSVPLWVERRQENRLAEAQALVRGRTAESDVLARELELRTRERVAQLEAALRIAALYRDKVLPLDELSLQSALASYQAGKVPFLTVLDALNAVFNDRALYAQRLAESAKWRVAIDEASLGAPSIGASASMGGMGEGKRQKAEGRNEMENGPASAMPSMR
jgi:outer membrane protein TolC